MLRRRVLLFTGVALALAAVAAEAQFGRGLAQPGRRRASSVVGSGWRAPTTIRVVVREAIYLGLAPRPLAAG